MKKICISLFSGLIILALTMCLNAQSSEPELNQTELMKQFIGTWKTDRGIDTAYYWTWTPIDDNGIVYRIKGELKAGGETYRSFAGILYILPNGNKIHSLQIMDNGMWPWDDWGRFTAKNKLVMKRFNLNNDYLFARYDMTFVKPDKIEYKIEDRGRFSENTTWENASVEEWTWVRVKK
ncbi:hypothetical protein ACFLRQ_02560 [Bacteroidota bacterium]